MSGVLIDESFVSISFRSEEFPFCVITITHRIGLGVLCDSPCSCRSCYATLPPTNNAVHSRSVCRSGLNPQQRELDMGWRATLIGHAPSIRRWAGWWNQIVEIHGSDRRLRIEGGSAE
jgi:hypothetical protein